MLEEIYVFFKLLEICYYCHIEIDLIKWYFFYFYSFMILEYKNIYLFFVLKF